MLLRVNRYTLLPAVTAALLIATGTVLADVPRVDTGNEDSVIYIGPNEGRALVAPFKVPSLDKTPLPPIATRGGFFGSLADVGPEIVTDQVDVCPGDIDDPTRPDCYITAYNGDIDFLVNVAVGGGTGFCYSTDGGTTLTPLEIGDRMYIYDVVRRQKNVRINGFDIRFWTNLDATHDVTLYFWRNTGGAWFATEPGSALHNPTTPYTVTIPADVSANNSGTFYNVRLHLRANEALGDSGYSVYIPQRCFSDPDTNIEPPANTPVTVVNNGFGSPAFFMPSGIDQMAVGFSYQSVPPFTDPNEDFGFVLASNDYSVSSGSGTSPEDLYGFFYGEVDANWTRIYGCGDGGNYWIWFGPVNCPAATGPGDDAPEGSAYWRFWTLSFGPPEPNDRIVLQPENGPPNTAIALGVVDTGLSTSQAGLRQGCYREIGQIRGHVGDATQGAVVDDLLDVDIFGMRMFTNWNNSFINPETGAMGFARHPRIRIDIDSTQYPTDTYVRMWEHVPAGVGQLGTLIERTPDNAGGNSADGRLANSDPIRGQLDPNFGWDMRLPSLDPLFVYDRYSATSGETVNRIRFFYVGVSWEGNTSYDPQADPEDFANRYAATGGVRPTGFDDPERADEGGEYFIKIAIGHDTRTAGGSQILDYNDAISTTLSTNITAALNGGGGTAQVTGNIGGNLSATSNDTHLFAEYQMAAGPFPNGCLGDVDTYRIQSTATGLDVGNMIEARLINSQDSGAGNLALAVYSWDGNPANPAQLIAVHDDQGPNAAVPVLGRTDPRVTAIISQDVDHYIAVQGVGDAADINTASGLWYNANGFTDTLPVLPTRKWGGTIGQNVGGQGTYDLLVTIGRAASILTDPNGNSHWEPNNSLTEALTNAFVPDNVNSLPQLSGIPAGQVTAAYLSAEDPAIGEEGDGGLGIHLGDGYYGEDDSGSAPDEDRGGDVDIYAFEAEAGQIVTLEGNAGSSAQLVGEQVPNNRHLVGTTWLVSDVGDLIAGPGLNIGNNRTSATCTGFDNLTGVVTALAPYDGTYYCVVAGRDSRRPNQASMLPYDLTKDGTTTAGYIQVGPGTGFCREAAPYGMYDLTIRLSQSPPCPEPGAMLIYIDRRGGNEIWDVNPTTFQIKRQYGLPQGIPSNFPVHTQTFAALAAGVEVQTSALPDGTGTCDGHGGGAIALSSLPDHNPWAIAPRCTWINPGIDPGDNNFLVLYYSQSLTSNQPFGGGVGNGDLNRADDQTEEKIWMLLPSSGSATLPVLGTFSYDPVFWATGAGAPDPDSWAIGTYNGGEVATATDARICDNGDGTTTLVCHANDRQLAPGVLPGAVPAGGPICGAGPDGVLDTAVGSEVRCDVTKEYLYILDQASFDEDGNLGTTSDRINSNVICKLERETGYVDGCFKILDILTAQGNALVDGDMDGVYFRGGLGHATLRDWDGPGLDRNAVVLATDDAPYSLIFLDTSSLNEIGGATSRMRLADEDVNLGGLTSLNARNLDCRNQCPDQCDPPIGNCSTVDNHDVIYVGRINTTLDVVFNADADSADRAVPGGGQVGSVITNGLCVAYAGINLPDEDCDGVVDAVDNCLGLVNPNQIDGDNDGIGDACSERICAGDDLYAAYDDTDFRGTAGTSFNFASSPIPADFFGPGSEPFTGTVVLDGSPLTAQYPDTTTSVVIGRTAHSYIPTASSGLTPPFTSLVPTTTITRFVSLVGTAPITVTGAGGGTFDVAVEASAGQWTGGRFGITLTRTTANGGTYQSNQPANLRFIFTPTGGGTDVIWDQSSQPGGAPDGTDRTLLVTSGGVWVTAAALSSQLGAQPELACVNQQSSWANCSNAGFETEESNALVPGVADNGSSFSVERIQWTEEDEDEMPRNRARLNVGPAQSDPDMDGLGDCDASPPGCVCGELAAVPNNVIDLQDFAAFSTCFGADVGVQPECGCADLNADGVVTGQDFATFATIFSLTPDGVTVPNCLSVD